MRPATAPLGRFCFPRRPPAPAVANSFSGHPAIDSDARFIVFQSDASGLTPLATNGTEQIILADTCLGPIVPVGCAPSLALISVNPSGGAGNSNSFSPWVSKTGRFVGFSSNATDLVPNDTNGHADAFVRDTCFGAPAGCNPSHCSRLPLRVGRPGRRRQRQNLPVGLSSLHHRRRPLLSLRLPGQKLRPHCSNLPIRYIPRPHSILTIAGCMVRAGTATRDCGCSFRQCSPPRCPEVLGVSHEPKSLL